MPNDEDERWYWEVIKDSREVVARGVAHMEPAAGEKANEAGRMIVMALRTDGNYRYSNGSIRQELSTGVERTDVRPGHAPASGSQSHFQNRRDQELVVPILSGHQARL